MKPKRFTMMLGGALLIATVGCHVAHAATLDQILDAICTVETGGRDVTGDHGAAIGPYQIHAAYWKDSGVPGRYEDCHDDAYSRQVILEYWRRYCPAAVKSLDAETLARVHNGGWNGMKKIATLKYWVKVKASLVGGVK